jgi:hypothetical protein
VSSKRRGPEASSAPLPFPELVCVTLCRYYKPGQREEPGCGGVVWLGRRPEASVRLRGLSPASGHPLFGLEPEDPRLRRVCGACAYLPDGCDFRDPDVPRSACAPCGGLRAVAALLALAGDVDLELEGPP